MRYHESLNIVFMRDNGPRRGFRARMSHVWLFLLLLATLPCLCVLLAIQCWHLWRENEQISASLARFEAESRAAQARAEKLENLEGLLDEENTPGREIILRRLAMKETRTVPQPQAQKEQPQKTEEGPGHGEFPEFSSGRVNVGNVQIRARRGGSLRISLDLRNPEGGSLLSGDVRAILVEAGGERKNLAFSPPDAGNFRINRFKRAVMQAAAPPDASLEDAQVILEVLDQAGGLLYRNIFAVQR